MWQALLGRADTVTRSWPAGDDRFAFNGVVYPLSYGGSQDWAKTEDIGNSFVAYCQQLYKECGVVYAVMAARRLLFKQARIVWQGFDEGVESKDFWTPELEVFRRPWPNGTTGELLSRMDQDVSLGGNFYAVREDDRIRRLRPDWMTIVLTAPPADAVRSDVAGYWFHPGRTYAGVSEPDPKDEFYLAGEVAHWTPDPDPEAQYRGMSWLSPVLREIVGDKAATVHKERFFANGATLGPVFSAKENLTPDQFQRWKDNILAGHQGADKAYRPLFLASPVDVSVRSVDLQQLDFKRVQGHGETRICAAGRVPPIVVGVSEGLEAATYSNYGQARRAFGDGWAHPQWEDACGALETIAAPPDKPARLWYAHKHIAFLREDLKDEAEIRQVEATTITSLVNGGFTPDSATQFVQTGDPSTLKHTGMTSVQLQPPVDPNAAPAAPGERAAEEEPLEDLTGEAEMLAASEAARADIERRDDDQLKHYWTRGEGLAKWAASPHPWTALYRELKDHMPDEMAKRVAAEWFHEVKGYWPGRQRGENPVGPG